MPIQHDTLPKPDKSQAAPDALLASGFHELLGAEPGDETRALGFALSLAERVAAGSGKPVCHCGLAHTTQEHGRLYGSGLACLGAKPDRMLMVSAANEKDLLWTLEEAVTSGAFGAVIGTLGARERLYGFTASRRLKLRAQTTRTSLFLIRHRLSGGATAANGRWRIACLPCPAADDHVSSKWLGPPKLRLAVERMGGVPPQSWEMDFDVSCGFHMASQLENGQAGKAVGRRRQAV